MEDTHDSRKGSVKWGDTVSVNTVTVGKIHMKKEKSYSGVVGEWG